MPYQFPPPENQHLDIRERVEQAKADLGFNDRLHDKIICKIHQYGFHTPNEIACADAGLNIIIDDYINPEIQRIVLCTVETDPYYLFPSLTVYRKTIKRYDDVSLFSLNNAEKSQYKSDAESIFTTIYNKPSLSKRKSVSIMNLITFFFCCECSYLTNKDKLEELLNSFRRSAPRCPDRPAT